MVILYFFQTWPFCRFLPSKTGRATENASGGPSTADLPGVHAQRLHQSGAQLRSPKRREPTTALASVVIALLFVGFLCWFCQKTLFCCPVPVVLDSFGIDRKNNENNAGAAKVWCVWDSPGEEVHEAWSCRREKISLQGRFVYESNQSTYVYDMSHIMFMFFVLLLKNYMFGQHIIQEFVRFSSAPKLLRLDIR